MRSIDHRFSTWLGKSEYRTMPKLAPEVIDLLITRGRLTLEEVMAAVEETVDIWNEEEGP